MPITRKQRTPDPVAEAPPSPADQGPFGKLGKWLGTGVRVGAGWLPTSVMGGPMGALTGGGAELLAEGLEGSLDWTTPTRVLTEGAIGAVPLGKVLSSGRALKSAAKSGAFGGVGDFGRQVAEGNFAPGGEGLDEGRLAMATGLGGASGAILGKFFQGAPAPPEPVRDVIENMGGGVPRPKKGPSPGVPAGATVRSAGLHRRPGGPDVNYTGGIDKVEGYSVRPSDGPTPPPTGPGFARTAYNNADEVVEEDNFSTMLADELSKKPKWDSDLYSGDLNDIDKAIGADRASRGRIANANRVDEASTQNSFVSELDKLLTGKLNHAEARVYGGVDELDTAIQRETKFGDARRKASGQREKDLKAEDIIEQQKAGRVEAPATITETFSSPIPGGKQTASRRWVTPDADDAEGAGNGVNLAGAQAERQALDGGAFTPELALPMSGRIEDLLTNITDPVAKRVFENAIRRGETDRMAYKLAYQTQEFRLSRQAPNTLEAAGQPNSNDELMKLLGAKADDTIPGQSTHPSFYDDGFDSLEDAAPRIDMDQLRQTTHPSFFDDGFDGLAMAKPSRPAGNSLTQLSDEVMDDVPGWGKNMPEAARLRLREASETYPDEVYDELVRASEIYNTAAKGSAEYKAAGKDLGRLTKFMGGSPQGPKAGSGVAPAAASQPDWIAEQNAVADQLGALNAKGQKGIGEVEAVLSTALGVTGGLVGYAKDDEGSPWEGALAGAALGAGLPLAPSLARAVGRSEMELGDPNRVKEIASLVVSKLPQWQRFSLLADPVGLPANAIVGPWGSVVTGAVEAILKGDPRGLPLLKEAWNPAEFTRGMWRSKDEAFDALRRGELGRDAIDDRVAQQGMDTFDNATLLPGWAMTAGDSHARRLLERHGFSPEEARNMTLTGEPQANLTRQISNFGKGSWLGNLMMPFKRTPANILETGSQRIPGIGAFVNEQMGRDLSGREAAVEQGLGGLLGLGAYGAAAVNPDDASRRNIRRYVTNFGGRYSLPVSLGYMAGDASARDRSLKQTLRDPFTYDQIFPLPTTQPLQELVAKPLFGSDSSNTLSSHIPNSMNLRAVRRVLGMEEQKPGIRRKPKRPKGPNQP